MLIEFKLIVSFLPPTFLGFLAADFYHSCEGKFVNLKQCVCGCHCIGNRFSSGIFFSGVCVEKREKEKESGDKEDFKIDSNVCTLPAFFFLFYFCSSFFHVTNYILAFFHSVLALCAFFLFFFFPSFNLDNFLNFYTKKTKRKNIRLNLFESSSISFFCILWKKRLIGFFVVSHHSPLFSPLSSAQTSHIVLVLFLYLTKNSFCCTEKRTRCFCCCCLLIWSTLDLTLSPSWASLWVYVHFEILIWFCNI